MALQSNIDAATQKLTASTAETVQATTNLKASVAQLTALNIPAPLNTDALLSAVDGQVAANADMAQAVTDAQTAVNAEATKISPAS